LGKLPSLPHYQFYTRFDFLTIKLPVNYRDYHRITSEITVVSVHYRKNTHITQA
jgi:hypothetical protein